MQYLTLQELKRQMNIDQDFTDDDTLIESLGTTAEELVSQQVDAPLAELEVDGRLPEPLRHAMRMVVEYFYDNRGSGENMIPEAYFYVCRLYRKY